MKILKITNSYPHSKNEYAGVFVSKQASNLSRSGINVTVINPTPKKIGRFFNNQGKKINENNSINVLSPEFRQFPTKAGFVISIFNFYMSIKKKIMFLEIKNYDIIHAHWATPSGLASIIIGKKYNIPVVITLRGSDINKYPKNNVIIKFITKYTLKNAKKIITVSEKLKTDVISNYGIDPLKVATLYNGVDLKKFNLATFEEKDEKCKKPFILFVGTIKKEKGIYELLNAFHDLSSEHNDLMLNIIGTGEASKDVKKFIVDNHLQEKINLIGEVPNKDLYKWYSTCEFVVLPSYSEGMPNVLVEAIACGKKVIGTNVGGIPEIISLGVGELVEVKNVISLKNAIEKLIEEKSSDKNEAIIRDIASKHFDEEQTTKQLINIYNTLL